ncbi:hypothetical protein BBP40_005623 [Aspergillus hancockii]|nr:hypothetical protein BBP40_005623 [Aspergillus hancockii]
MRIIRIRDNLVENWLSAGLHHYDVWKFATNAPLRSTPTIFTADPANVQVILIKHFGDWGIEPGWSRSRAIMSRGSFALPPGGVNSKQALQDTVLPTGGGPDGSQPIAVTQGTPVLLMTYIMLRQPDLWVDDAVEWKPDRWTGLRPGWNYIP